MYQPSTGEADAQPLFEPIFIRYDGLDAASHEIDLHEFGKSAQGLAKIICTVATFVTTSNYDPAKRKLDCRVTIQEPRANCFSVTALIHMADQHPIIYTAIGGTIATGAGGAFTIIFAYLWNVITGKNKEMDHLHTALMEAIGQLGRRDESAKLLATIEKMALGLLPAAKDAVRPIGSSCETIRFGNQTRYYTELNKDDKDVILGNVFEITDANSYRVLITELDMKKHTCKVSLPEDLEERYNAKIVDPQLVLFNNPYALAMAAQRLVTVIAKLKMVDNQIREFVISDIEKQPI